MDHVNVGVKFRWVPLGRVSLDDAGRLVFPKAPVAPGLYRFDLEKDGRPTTYVGESDLLARRLQHYRTPGPTQRTNLRLNDLFRTLLAQGTSISVSIVTDDIQVSLGSTTHSANLNRKQDRVLLEHAALLAAYAGGHSILNA